VPVAVTVLEIDGEDYYAYATEIMAWNKLHNFCETMWLDLIPDIPRPEDQDECISTFFEYTNMWYKMRTLMVQGS
jgi:hypothetical protein